MRHAPRLLRENPRRDGARVSAVDQMRFVYYRFKRFWLRWTLLRSVLTGGMGLREANALRRRLEGVPVPDEPPPLRELSGSVSVQSPVDQKTVTVLIPTVDRYPYLKKLLGQFRLQTVPPLEIIIVDQTSPEHRDTGLVANFPDLPVRVFYLDRAGQCTSRNAGLEASRGDYVLFVDDDDEVPPDLIERHLASLGRFRSDVSCGVAEEDGAGPLPPAFRLIRSSDVFPTNNSLILKAVLSSSGLFDLTYDRGARADADLGMRLYLSGCLMVLNPEIRVIHHHASSGGLRKHGARIITYASSRRRLMQRHLPAITEIYLVLRYFSPDQVREMLWLQTAATLALKGSPIRKALKALVAIAQLPSTLRQIRRRRRAAEAFHAVGPRVPVFVDSRAQLGETGKEAGSRLPLL